MIRLLFSALHDISTALPSARSYLSHGTELYISACLCEAGCVEYTPSRTTLNATTARVTASRTLDIVAATATVRGHRPGVTFWGLLSQLLSARRPIVSTVRANVK